MNVLLKRLIMSFLAIGNFELSINYCYNLKKDNEIISLLKKESINNNFNNI
jgi:hypothetical protein